MMAVVESDTRRALQSEIESPTAKLVYLSLALEGEATPATLAERTGESRLSIYGVLQALVERELVTTQRDDGRMVYAVP